MANADFEANRPSAEEANAEKVDSQSRSRSRRAQVWQLYEQLEKAEVELAKVVTNSLGLKLVLIPAGSFLMGSPPEEAGRRFNEGPPHEISFSKPFYFSVHPVSQSAYQRIMGENPSRFTREGGGGGEHPVENISWSRAVAFCEKLTALTEERTAGRKYRLPTEAEWEYACRAGSKAEFAFGGTLTSTQANFDGNYPYGEMVKGPCAKKTTRVGAYAPNHFGLCDMHGNVWEWCQDWFDDHYYQNSPPKDPQGPRDGQFRVVRGGSWRNQAVVCRSAYRNGFAPHHHDMYTGFRVVAVQGAAT